eukprot:6129482-Alexandrium_andersonii.AAC.1
MPRKCPRSSHWGSGRLDHPHAPQGRSGRAQGVDAGRRQGRSPRRRSIGPGQWTSAGTLLRRTP